MLLQKSDQTAFRSAVSRADLASCRETLYNGSRTFFLASLFLPRRVREPASALYTFCRIADDEIDVHGGRLLALARLHERLDRAYSGRPDSTPLDRAFTEVVNRFEIPRTLPEALLEGLEWDAKGRRYEDLSGLNAYAARVAGSVGAMMARLMGVRCPDVLASACNLGVAMQLSNIARDVGEDARAGRIYLPLRWLEEAGIDPEAWLASPTYSDNFSSVMDRLLREADKYYRQADMGIARLPAACRPGINAARLLYAEIGREAERLGDTLLTRRAVVPASRKASLVTQALAATVRPRVPQPATVIEETRYLVQALTAHRSPIPVLAGETLSEVAWWNLPERIVRVITLFEELGHFDRDAQVYNGPPGYRRNVRQLSMEREGGIA